MPGRFKLIALLTPLFLISLSDASASSVAVYPPSVTLSAGQALTFSATVGAGAGAITWKLSPAVGTITNGYYVAPRVIAAAQTVAVIATTASFQTGSAIISLMPGAATGGLAITPSATQNSLSLTPPSVSLISGQTAYFTAVVNGVKNNAAVAWSVAPPVGTIWNGTYLAPGTMATSQTVTVTATSLSGPAQTASAIVSLIAANVSITPPSASLSAGKGASFSAVVTGESSSAVSWSLSPAVGTITNGYYLAPATIKAAQTVTLTATSLSNSSVSASVPIYLTATSTPATVQLTPASISLNPGQSTQFSLQVSGSATPAAWSLVPNVGSVSNGLYTAPASVSKATSLTLMATNLTNSSETASAAISLQASPSVSVSLSPSSASLSSGQTAKFSATVSGSTNTAVNWSLSPAVGSL